MKDILAGRLPLRACLSMVIFPPPACLPVGRKAEIKKKKKTGFQKIKMCFYEEGLMRIVVGLALGGRRCRSPGCKVRQMDTTYKIDLEVGILMIRRPAPGYRAIQNTQLEWAM